MPLPYQGNKGFATDAQSDEKPQKPGLQQQEKPKKSTGPPQWNPTGYWPDPYAERFRKNFRPHEFIGALNASPEAQAYGNPEELASTVGAQSVREGEQAVTEESTQEAANQGLGRGYAQQQKTNIRQQGNQQISDNILGAHLEGQSRRYQQAAMLAASLMEANKSRFTSYLNKKAQESAADSDLLGFVGDFLGGALEAIPGIGGLFDDDEEAA